MLKLFRSKIILALVLMISVLLVGMIGYRFISDYSWLDALYMTVITVTTVGYREIQPLGEEAKIFTVLLITCSVFIFAFALSVVTEYILGKNSLQLLKRKKMKSKVNALSGHVIVCGFGRNGQQAVSRLIAYNRPLVVIEKNIEEAERFDHDLLVIEGDATEDAVLLEAGIKRAAYLIVALPDDAANLFVVLTAKQLNEDLFIISRATQVSSQKKLELAGANKVIMPDKIGGDHMASLVVLPDLITFMDKLSMRGGDTTNLEEVAIENFADQTEVNTLRDLDLRKKTGCTIIGYVDPEGNYIINPEADLPMEPKSKVIVLGRPEQIKKLNSVFHIHQS